MNPLILIRIAHLLTPATARARMTEEWRADLAGAAEVGLPAGSIARGALRTAIGARAARVGTAIAQAFAASSTVLMGIAVGALCAVGDVSALVVCGCAALVQAAAIVAIRGRRAALHAHARRAA